MNKQASKPLIFISHDTRDAHLALAFSRLIQTISIDLLEPFRSSDTTGTQGIPAGAEWFPFIRKKVNEAKDVVCLLTPRSFARPWLLYEAGLAHGLGDRRVLGIAIDVELEQLRSGPFAQFQNCSDDADSLLNVVNQLLKHIPNAHPKEQTVTDAIDEFRRASRLPGNGTIEGSNDSPTHDLFIAAPMAALASDSEYQEQRTQALTLIDCFQSVCGFKSIVFAGKNIVSAADFESPDVSVKDDLDSLSKSARFVLLYPRKLPTSALVEAGAALALGIPSLYCVAARKDLPFLLERAEQGFPYVRIYECERPDQFAKLIQKNGLKLFPSAAME